MKFRERRSTAWSRRKTHSPCRLAQILTLSSGDRVMCGSAWDRSKKRKLKF